MFRAESNFLLASVLTLLFLAGCSTQPTNREIRDANARAEARASAEALEIPNPKIPQNIHEAIPKETVAKIYEKYPDLRNLPLIGNVVTPRPIHLSKPMYPINDLEFRQSGQVEVTFVVIEDGTVGDAWLNKTSGRNFGIASIDAVRKWKFSPGSRNGKPGKFIFVVPIRFLASPPPRSPAPAATP